MSMTRQKVVDLALSWEGKNESDGSFKSIIDIYNSYKGTLPRGTKMQYNWEWCACTWSAQAIKLGYTKIMPIEISCYYLIEAAKKMGCWKEKDNYVAQPGDAILYDWNDSGKGENTGAPEHVGTIIETNKKGGYFIVMEGNYNQAVKRRKVAINGKYIRGFIAPKYDDEPKKTTNKTTKIETKKTTEKTTEKKKDTTKKVTAKASADKFDENIAGTYRTTAALHLRNDAGKSHKSLCIIPKGAKVVCYGYYSIADGNKWYYVQATVKGVEYTGFSHSAYLKK